MSRSLQPEELDDLGLTGPTLHRTLADLGRLNRWLGNTCATTRTIRSLLADVDAPTIVELACGGGDLLAAAGAALPGAALIGVDGNPSTAAWAARRCPRARLAVADITDPGYRPPECDVLLLSHFLYHLPDPAARALLARLAPRVRRAIVVSELVRSRAAGWGFSAAAALLGVSGLTRRDGHRAIARAWRPDELRAVLAPLPPPLRWTLRRPDPFRMIAVISCGTSSPPRRR